MTKRIGIGIIGCGAISRFHINGYLALPEKARILAVCDVIEERAQSRAEEVLSESTKQAQQVFDGTEKAATASEKEKLTARQALYEEYSQSGVKVFTDLHEMLKLPGLDAVSVCTPPFVHAKATIASAKAGKHVFCEKPMAMNATEARAMCEACNQASVKLGYQSGGTRLGAVNLAIRNYIVSGKLGDVYYGRATSFRIRGRPGVDQRWFIDSTKAGGGALYDIGVYDIDKVLYLLGDAQPSTISAIAYRGIGGPVDVGEGIDDVEEHASVFVRFTNGMSFTFEKGWATNMAGISEGIFIFGSLGAFRGETLLVFDEGKIVEGKLEVPDIPNPGQIGDFLNACLSSAKPISSGEDGIKVMEIMSGALLSAKLGREVAVEELYAIEKIRMEPRPGWPI
jgi:predicted dehydrogenase